MRKMLTGLCLLMPLAGATAQEAAPPPPPPDPAAQAGDQIEPQVTIIRRKDAVIEEYRINGVLYMVRINPTSGPAYYLVDRDGDGSMESRSRGLADPEIPQWVLFSW